MGDDATRDLPPTGDVPSRFTIDFTGETLLGTYRVDRRIAEGGMGSIYLGEDTNLGRRVVIKVPHPRFLAERGFRARFAREMNELVRLEHPHIVRILARGEHDEVPFFVLQYLGGGSLEDRMEETSGEPVVAVDALRWFRTTAETLDYVHGQGVVHRDVKPGNILFDETGHVFLSDFGVAKVVEAEHGGLTDTGIGIGSPKYMAPEQGFGKETTAAADQYALASTLYEALTGRLPHGEGQPVELLVRKGREDPTSIRDHLPSLPQAAADAVMRGLAREPEDRYPSCTALAADFTSGLGLTEATLVGLGTPPSGTQVVSVPPGADGPGLSRRTRLGLGVGLLLLVGVALAALTRGGRNDAPATPPTASGEATGTSDERLTLLGPGEEPRRALRYVVEPGAEARFSLTLKNEGTTTIGDEVLEERQIPEITIVADTRVERLDEDDGTIHFRWESRDATVPSGEGLGENAALVHEKIAEAFRGIVAHGAVTDRGLTREVRFPEGDNAPGPMLREQIDRDLRNIATPLPVEPVGVGARWEVTESVQHTGMRFIQTTTYELERIEGDQLHLRFGVAQTAPPQRVVSEEFEYVDGMRLKSHHVVGEGTVVVDLAHFVPVRSEWKVTIDMVADIDAGGEPMPFELHMRSALQMIRHDE